jgi:hypothetical protein
MIGGTLVLVLTGTAAQAAWGANSLTEALLLAAFPAALMLSSECTYFKPYSRAARLTLAVGGALLIVLITWVSVFVGQRV